jgi:CTP synthase (UTP-ammonia lyase)
MTHILHIGLIGDYQPEVKAHQAIPRALALAGADLGLNVETTWLATPRLEGHPEELLEQFDRLWAVPATPYHSMEGALNAIRYAREQQVPFLGTCGGFQHAIIEFARHVLGLHDADHAETSPDGSTLVIAPLSCSMVEVEASIRLVAGSRMAAIFGKLETVEGYHCNYGLNPAYQAQLEQAGMKISGFDAAGDPRTFELEGHPFFFGTLFQPERSAFKGVVHPLIRALLQPALAGQPPEPSGSSAQPGKPRINKIRSQPRAM